MTQKPKPFSAIARNRSWQATIAEAVAYLAELRKPEQRYPDGSIAKAYAGDPVYAVFVRTRRLKTYSINVDTPKNRELSDGIMARAAVQGVKVELLCIAEETELAAWAAEHVEVVI